MTEAGATADVRVTALSVAPVKGTRLQTVDELTLGADGVPGDRRFYVVDERGRMLNAKVLGELTAVVAQAPDPDRLRLCFPDGTVVEDEVRDGAPRQTRFYSRTREDVAVAGPFAEALGRFLGRPVTLVRACGPGAVDRGRTGAVTVISRASLERLADAAEVSELDARRFRMTIELDGVAAHAEDAWVGRRLRVGAAIVRPRGHVGRCLITSRHPETGVVDVPTLDALSAYRTEVQSTEPLPFGVYAEVLQPGTVRIGDAVSVLGPSGSEKNEGIP